MDSIEWSATYERVRMEFIYGAPGVVDVHHDTICANAQIFKGGYARLSTLRPEQDDSASLLQPHAFTSPSTQCYDTPELGETPPATPIRTV